MASTLKKGVTPLLPESLVKWREVPRYRYASVSLITSSTGEVLVSSLVSAIHLICMVFRSTHWNRPSLDARYKKPFQAAALPS